MIAFRRIAAAGAALLLLAAGCGPERAPTAALPASAAAAPAHDLGSLLGGQGGGLVDGLLACPTAQSFTATQVVGPAGGVIQVGPHALYVPAGALAAPVTITATAPAGQYAEVQFAPQGLQFIRPAALRMSYAQCGLLSPLVLHIVYADDQLNILQVLPSLTDLFTQTVTANLSHFSAYLLAD